MRIADYIEQSFRNLWRKRLRTTLTVFGVMIGIGALVSMFSFGKGVQKNITEQFEELELFNYISVYPGSEKNQPAQATEGTQADANEIQEVRVLDDKFIEEVMKIKGVETAFAEVRFPAVVRFDNEEQFALVQVLPADVCRSGLVKLRAGSYYADDEPNSLIISDILLNRMNIEKPEAVTGRQIEVATLTADVGLLNPANIASVVQGDKLPFTTQSYKFTIVGVNERMGFGGPLPIRSDVFIPHKASEKMNKISLTSINDFFQSPQQAGGYSMVSVRLSSIKYVDSVNAKIKQWGFGTFALIDQLEEIKKGFVFMDMFLFAVAMIAITVASLGIINTMVMSILERYREIGIMKAIGASDGDVKKIFFFESGVIGFLGGVFGLGLGWAVSKFINLLANYFLTNKGVPYINYFSFPLWLCLGAVIFSILISLAAGIYPTLRAARVDPVVALRHD